MQPFLHGPQNFLIIARARQNQTPGCKAMKGKTWRMEIGALQAPQHRPLRRKPGQDTGKESCRHRAILAFCPGAPEFMQRAQRQAAPGQAGIDGRDPERQNRPNLPAVFEGGELLSQSRKLCPFATCHLMDPLNVLYLFLSELKSQAFLYRPCWLPLPSFEPR